MKAFFKYLGFTILLLVFGGSLYLAIADPTIPVTIKEETAQKMADKFLPFSKTIDVKIPVIKDRKADLFIKSAKLDFLPSGGVQIESPLSVKMDGRFVKGVVNAESDIVYRDGQFFLGNIKINKIHIEEFELTEADQKKLNTGKKIAEGSKKLIAKWNKFIKKEDKGGALENGISESKVKEYIKSIRNDLIKKLERFAINKFESIPIYKLDSSKTEHNLAKLMLKDITVNDDELIITMNVGKLVSTVWLYIVSFLAAIGFVVMLFTGGGRNGRGGNGGGAMLSGLADISLDL